MFYARWIIDGIHRGISNEKIFSNYWVESRSIYRYFTRLIFDINLIESTTNFLKGRAMAIDFRFPSFFYWMKKFFSNLSLINTYKRWKNMRKNFHINLLLFQTNDKTFSSSSFIKKTFFFSNNIFKFAFDGKWENDKWNS